jgi:hypothetical protein
VHRDFRSLRSRLEGGLGYISAAVLLVPLEGDLNASVGTVRDEIEDGAVLPIVVSKCAIAADDCWNSLTSLHPGKCPSARSIADVYLDIQASNP